MFNLVGRRIDRYKIQAEIGRGGMARVYRALDTILGRQVALKVLSPQLANDPEFSARFRREGKIVAALQHAHIVTLFDVGESEGIQYLAMDFIDGRSVYAVIRERDALPAKPSQSLFGLWRQHSTMPIVAVRFTVTSNPKIF